MDFGLDRPWDRLITERVQLLSGWTRGAARNTLIARCGDHPIPLRCFRYPLPDDAELDGFYGFLVLQQVLPWVEKGWLRVRISGSSGREVILHLRVSPLAEEAARNSPLNLEIYPIGGRGKDSANPPQTLVFPGLGCVGGTTLNLLFRMKMYRQGLDFPVYSEANDPVLWSRLCNQSRPAIRWIDGHNCFHAADLLERPYARFTMLRDPMKRLLSVFNYSSLVHPRDFSFATIDDFLLSPDLKHYSQAAGLLRCAGNPCAPGTPDDELYGMAGDEIKQSYDLVGITELYEETIFLICRLARYPDINMWWRVLSTPGRIAPGDLSERALQAASQALAVDYRLYKEAKSKLLQQLAASDFGASLAAYKKDALRQPELSEAQKMAECLRWRQTLTEEELFRLCDRAKRQNHGEQESVSP